MGLKFCVKWGTPGDIPRFAWNGPGMGWPELILPRRARGAAGKKVSVLTGNPLGWSRHAEKCRKRWVSNSGSNWGTPRDIPRVCWNGAGIRLGTFFDIQNRLLLLTSKIQTGYWFFHHIKDWLLVCTYVSKQVPVIDNLGVQLSVVQVV